MQLLKKLTLGYSPFGNADSIYPFDELFKEKKNIENGMDGVDCVILWGGADMHPSYYNENPHPMSGASTLPSKRDVFEWKTILYCKANNIPIIGICLGAQRLCVAAGGSLVQHCVGHSYDHNIKTIDGESIWATSSHHQMMNPHKIPHKLLAWTEHRRCYNYENGKGIHIKEMLDNEEPEVVYFPQVNGLAIQGHPEYGSACKAFRDYSNRLVEEYLLKRVDQHA